MYSRSRVIIPIYILFLLLVSSLSKPNNVIGQSTTNYQVGDSFTYTVNDYVLLVELDGNEHINTGNYSFLSLDESIDVTVQNTSILDLPTSQTNISLEVNFENPNVLDPNGTLFTISNEWDESLKFGSLLASFLVTDFDPNTAIFGDTIVYEDEFFVDPLIQPMNGSILFPYDGGEILPFFVDTNETPVNSYYNQYRQTWGETNTTGTLEEGYSYHTVDINNDGSDITNRTEVVSQFISWDNESKIFDYDYKREEFYSGTFSANTNSFDAYSSYTFDIYIDFKIGIVLFYDQELIIQYSIPGNSYYLLHSFAFEEEKFQDIGSTTSTSETSSSRSLVTSTPTQSSLTRTSSSEPTSPSDTSSTESTDPRVPFTTPYVVFLALFLPQVLRRRLQL